MPITKRRSRQAAIDVIDAPMLGIVVQHILSGFSTLVEASQALGIGRRTLQRLADGRAGATVTRAVFHSLEIRADQLDDLYWEEHGAEIDPYHTEADLVSMLWASVMTGAARSRIGQHRAWLDEEFKRYDRTARGPLTKNAGLIHERNRNRGVRDTTACARRNRAFDRAVADIRKRPGLKVELEAFERRAEGLGWRRGMARYQLALRRALGPLLNDDDSGIERTWSELLADESKMASYLKAAFQKELVLLDRKGELARATDVSNASSSSPAQ